MRKLERWFSNKHRLACFAAMAMIASAGAAEIRWEAENATGTNLLTATPPSSGNEVLSGGKWLYGPLPGAGSLYADYQLTIPAAGTYRFYVRRFWHHGPFRYRFDDQSWTSIDAARDLLDTQEVKKGVPVCWTLAGAVTLTAGSHSFRIEPQQLPGYRYNSNYGFDCFLLTTEDRLPKGAADTQPDQHALYRSQSVPDTNAPAGFYEANKGRILHVDGTSARAADSNPGTADQPFKSISAAAALVKPGDMVLVAAGIYRECIALTTGGTADAPIRFVAAKPGCVVVRGSEELRTKWLRRAEGEWEAELPPALIKGTSNPYVRRISIGPKENKSLARPIDPAKDRLWPKTLGQMFVNGEPYRQLENPEGLKRSPGSWMVSADGTRILANFYPAHQPESQPLVELSVQERIFAPTRRGLGFIQLKGLVFEHCANQGPFPQGGAVSTRAGHHWRIENCIIRYAATIGLDCGSESWDLATIPYTLPEDRVKFAAGYHLISNNLICDNGLAGIAGLGHRNTVVYGNVIERNNREDFAFDRCEWEEWAGIKFHDCDGARIEGNLIRDNEGYGIWFDNRFYDTRITRNLIINNRMAGIFYELGRGPALADNNIIAYTRARGSYYNGIGIYAHDAAGLTLAHNLLFENAGSGILLRTTSKREFSGYSVNSSKERILNNILWGNAGPAICLPLENELARDNRSDYNLLYGTHDYWQGQDSWPALFAVNLYLSSASKDQYLQTITQALQKSNLPMDLPALENWRRNPVLSLRQWRAVTGNDLHSAEAPKAAEWHFKPLPLVLSGKMDESFLRMRCPRLPECDRDYNGNAIQNDAVSPGPFQSIQPGEFEWPLWPVATMDNNIGRSASSR